MEDLNAIEDWAGGMLARLQPAARRALLLDIGRELRRSQQKRIAEQRNPDGTAFEPRKAPSKNLRGKAGRIKRRAMFLKMRTARFLKITTDAEGLALGFSGRAANIARVHQEGEVGKVAPGIDYKYPARRLLGLTDAERDMIRDKLLAYLAQ